MYTTYMYTEFRKGRERERKEKGTIEERVTDGGGGRARANICHFQFQSSARRMTRVKFEAEYSISGRKIMGLDISVCVCVWRCRVFFRWKFLYVCDQSSGVGIIERRCVNVNDI